MANWRKLLNQSALVMNTTPDEKFDPKELKMGIEVEKEHGVTPEEAKSIAKDHLGEVSDYYSKLKQYVETKSSSKLSQRGKKIISMGSPSYLHCPGCGYQAPLEDFKSSEVVGFGLEEEEEEDDNFVTCPQCGRPFEKEVGDPFGSEQDLF